MNLHVGTVGIVDGAAEPATRLSEDATRWAATRNISRATLERLGVASGTAFFPDLERKAPALFFRYRDGWKARAFPDKGFVANKGFKPSFWNQDAVLASNPEAVFITEGELDACALVEAGIAADQVLSVPNGAVERTEENDRPRGYRYVEDALEAGLIAPENSYGAVTMIPLACRYEPIWCV